MADRKKFGEYREILREMAEPQKNLRRQHLEGKAAKLGTEIYGEERKGKLQTKADAKPRR